MFVPFSRVDPAWALTFATLLVTALALVVYKYTSSQDGIRLAKEKIKAHFVEVWLYIDDPVLILKAQAGIFANGGKYLAYALVPLAVMFLPVMVFLINCEYRFHYRQFNQGEVFLIKARVNSQVSDWMNAVKPDLPDTLAMDAPPLRIEGRDDKGNEFREIDFRVKVLKNGFYEMNLGAGKDITRLMIMADNSAQFRLAPYIGKKFSENFWNPGYSQFPIGAGIDRVEVSYPRSDLDFFGWKTWWVWPFIILMFVFAFALKPIIKVEF
jgi:hypothetical protein